MIIETTTALGNQLRVTLTDKEYTVIGTERNVEPLWKTNDAGGQDHWTTPSGKKLYANYFYLVDNHGTHCTYSSNKRLIFRPHPDPLPSEIPEFQGKKLRFEVDQDDYYVRPWIEDDYKDAPILEPTAEDHSELLQGLKRVLKEDPTLGTSNNDA